MNKYDTYTLTQLYIQQPKILTKRKLHCRWYHHRNITAFPDVAHIFLLAFSVVFPSLVFWPTVCVSVIIFVILFVCFLFFLHFHPHIVNEIIPSNRKYDIRRRGFFCFLQNAVCCQSFSTLFFFW